MNSDKLWDMAKEECRAVECGHQRFGEGMHFPDRAALLRFVALVIDLTNAERAAAPSSPCAPAEPAVPIGPLGPLDPNEEDAGRLWAEITMLREMVKGPPGFASWQDAAVHERRAKNEALRKLKGAVDSAYRQDSATWAAAWRAATAAAAVAGEPVAWRRWQAFDANLLAAAPDMFDALTFAEMHLTRGDTDPMVRSNVINSIRAAIAKATKEPPDER